MLVTQFEALEEPGADERDVLIVILTSHWTVLSPAQLK
jgi:gluconate kinase